MPDARRAQHGSANAGRAEAQPTGPVDAWAVFAARTRRTAAGRAEEEVH
jgi:hypothetical protein